MVSGLRPFKVARVEPLLIAVSVAFLLGLLVLLRSRRASAVGGKERASEASRTQTSEGLPSQGALLVPLPSARDEALVLGSDDGLAALERAGLIHTTSGPSSGPLPQVVRTVIAAGGTEANRRAAEGVESGRIVALSKETMKQLERNSAARQGRAHARAAPWR
jgi:hypothetical protein